MADYQLIAEPPLAGTDLALGTLRLRATGELSIVSIALPLGDEAAAEKALKSAYRVPLPESGHSVVSPEGVRIVRTGADQAMVLLPEIRQSPEQYVSETLKGTVYTTDQSDVWTALTLEGTGALAVLERICPLDLHVSVFPTDAAARTLMEHLGVMIIRTREDAFMLLSASSSATSFLHAIETSMRNVA